MRKKNALLGKRVLLIALPSYSTGMIKKMEEMGARVDYINDKPKDSFLGKGLGRLQIPFYIKYIEKYYHKKLISLKNYKYDFVLVIRGEYTPSHSLRLIRQLFPTAKLILYMWDSLVNNKNISKKWKYYDIIYTFDRMDYLENKNVINFLPLYYYENYLPFMSYQKEYQYDLSFIGTVHEDRYKVITEVCNQVNKSGGKTFSYFFSPHKIIFWLNKLRNKHYKEIKMSDVSFDLMPFEKLYEVYSNSKCVIDVESSTQNGLTMRTIEMIGLRKKLITTNEDIVNYDFYNPNNILVIDRNDPKIDFDFFGKPYEILNDEVYYKYSLEGWLLQIFGLEGE